MTTEPRNLATLHGDTTAAANTVSPMAPSPRRRRARPRPREHSVLAFFLLLAFFFSSTSYAIRGQQAALIGALALVIAGAFFQGRPVTIGGTSGKLLLSYGMLVALSVTTSIWLGPSIDGTVDMAKLMVLFIVTLNTVTTRNRIWWALAVLVALITIYPGIGAIRYYLAGIYEEPGRANWRGLYGNPNMAALTMLMHTPFAIGLFLVSRDRRMKLVWVISIVILITVSVLTESRAGFLALAALGAMSLFLVRRGKGYMMATVAVVAISMVAFAPDDFKERVGSIFRMEQKRDASAQSRLIIWKTAIEIALSRPITGIGVGTYERANADRAPDELGSSGGDRWKDTHNTFLNIWAEIGTPALIVFVAAFISLIMRSWKNLQRAPPREPLAIYLSAGIAAMTVFGMMGIFNTFHNAWFLYVLFAIMLSANRIVEMESACGGFAKSPPQGVRGRRRRNPGMVRGAPQHRERVLGG